jgi:transposase-like protein
MRTTVTALTDRLRTEADAWEFMEQLRWPNGPVCPACHGSDVYLVVPKNGVSRRTVSGSMSQRRTWNCRPCRRQFSATTGTMMHGTRVPIRTWVLCIFEACASKNGISACEIERKYGLCSRTAWFLMHRIREAMKSDALIDSMRGTIVADETYIGGDPKRMNKSARGDLYKLRMTPWVGDKFDRGTAKTPVLSLINAETGEVRPRVVPKVDGTNLRKIISEQVDMAGSTLWTDEGSWYGPLGRGFISHATVNHSADEYVDWITGASTNKAENFFSQLKRSIDGTYHHVSREHLPRYLTEFDYRFSTCKLSDGERMERLVRRAEGRRLTYKRVRTSH